MTVLIIGTAMAFNLLIILAKIRREQYVNALIDIICTLFICWMTSCTGAFIGLATGMVASGICSLYLMASPVKFSLEDIKSQGRKLFLEAKQGFLGTQQASSALYQERVR